MTNFTKRLSDFTLTLMNHHYNLDNLYPFLHYKKKIKLCSTLTLNNTLKLYLKKRH